MSQKLKRVLNAFVLGASGTFATFIALHYADLTNAVQVSDWASLKALGISFLAGAVVAGFRAVQAYFGAVPSPEAEENN
jgi:hypothetical protein